MSETVDTPENDGPEETNPTPEVKNVPPPKIDPSTITNASKTSAYPDNPISEKEDGVTVSGRYMNNGYAYTLQGVTQARYQVPEDEFEEAKAKLLYLKSLVAGSLKHYGSERKSARRWAFVFTMFSTLLAGVVTVLLGWRLFDDNAERINTLSNIALILSALITVMGVLSKFWDAKQLWVRYTDTENALKELMGYIEYTEQGLDKVKALHLVDVEALNLKYHMILQATNRLIHDVRSQN